MDPVGSSFAVPEASIKFHKKDPDVEVQFEKDDDEGHFEFEQVADPAAKAAPQKKWYQLNLADQETILLFAIPLFGLGYEAYLQRENDTAGHNQVKNKFDKNVTIQLIEKRNHTKKMGIIAMAINALVIGSFVFVFPLLGSMYVTGYLCFILKNLVQMNNNARLIKDIETDVICPPVGAGKSVPEGKTEFIWHNLVE